jgi:hypothetical protein
MDTKMLFSDLKLEGKFLDPTQLAVHFGVSIPEESNIHKIIALTKGRWSGISSLEQPFPAKIHNSYWGVYAMYPNWKVRLNETREKTYAFWNRLLLSAEVLEFFDVKSSEMRNHFMKVLRNG